MTKTQQISSPDLLKFAEGFMNFANNPNRTDAVFQMADGLRYSDLYQQFIKYARDNEAIDRILQERYLASPPNFTTLLQYPKNSLGQCYALRMVEAELDPDFYPKLAIEDDYSYIAIRLRQTHDIWHIMTGFETDLAGEMALQAFTLAQIRSPLAIALLSASIVHLIQVSGPLNAVVDRIQEGWKMGVKAKPFLAQKWEEQWEKPLTQLREELNIAASGLKNQN